MSASTSRLTLAVPASREGDSTARRPRSLKSGSPGHGMGPEEIPDPLSETIETDLTSLTTALTDDFHYGALVDCFSWGKVVCAAGAVVNVSQLWL